MSCTLLLNLALRMFQSTSSEEDVVSDDLAMLDYICGGFNPRPPKRTLCHGHIPNISIMSP